MKPRLSIIIPCYNCESTLEEAFLSCFEQNLDVPYEIVMVNDASTDGTRSLIEQLKNKRPPTGLFGGVMMVDHLSNKGGGAARNTAVENSSGDIIFCLDSDDILPKNTMSKMFNLLIKDNLDGVIFEEARFFSGHNIKKLDILKNAPKSPVVDLSDIFREGSGALTRVNFMYTKIAYTVAGGYPTSHGFDTQGFGVRFLSKGLKAKICPGAYYLHRRHNGESYFIREYNQNKFSFNSYLVYEEIMFLLSPQTQSFILSYDIFSKYKLGIDNLDTALCSLFKDVGEQSFFAPNYKKYLQKDGEQIYINEEKQTNPATIFVLNLQKNRSNISSFSIKDFDSVLQSFPTSKIVYMYIARMYLKKSGMNEKNVIDNVFQLYSVKTDRGTTVLNKLVRALITKLRAKLN